MAIEYLKKDNLKTAIEDSISYMRPFIAPLAEYERLGKAKPGRVPKGKPRVTDGTLAGKRREVPKQVVQQMPSGKVHIKEFPDVEKYANATLTDEIIPYANTGGTPFSKSKRALKAQFDNGAVGAYVFFNRSGEKLHADYKLVKARDLLFEKGKTSEFDSNFIIVKEWYTKTDLQAELDRCNAMDKKSEKYWDTAVLKELIDGAAEPKASDEKSDSEKNFTSEDNGFILLYHVMQRGVGAKFYRYSQKLNKVAYTCENKDPRGVIPVHVLVAEENDENPLGEPIFAISAGKQNLLDFEMQMHQYRTGILLDPPVKKWGAVAVRAIKLVPGNIIEMGANKQTSDFEAVDLGTSASQDFAGNYGLIKSQVLNELGTATGDTTISSESGNPSFSKTQAGVKSSEQRTDIFNNDLRNVYEEWQERIYETLLNVHFAWSQGKKNLDLQPSTRKQLDLKPDENAEVDYDKAIGPIKYSVESSTSEMQDDDKQNERLTFVLELTTKYPQPTPKQMGMINQIIQTSGVSDPEKYQYTDEEIAEAQKMEQQAKQAQAIATDQQMQQAQAQAQLGTGMPADGMAPPEEMPLEQPAQPALDPEEEELANGLLDRGVPKEDIMNAIVMYREGYNNEQILSALMAGGQQL